MRQEGGGGFLEFATFAEHRYHKHTLWPRGESSLARHKHAKRYHDIRRSNNYTAFRFRDYARCGTPAAV